MASGEAWRRECARRVLLEHLGILPLVSRFDAIGAKAAVRQLRTHSVHLSLPPFPRHKWRRQTGRAMGFDTDQAPITRCRFKRRRPGGTLIGATAPSLSPQGTSTQAGPKNQSSASEPPLSLLMAITGDVLWIETLEDQLLRREQLQLIGAMARAIRGPDVRTVHQQFDWPPRSGPALSAHSGGLTGMLTGFLQRLMTDHDARIIIQLGQVAALPALQAPVYELPSTLAMLREGSRKRSAWAVLRPLQQRA